MNTRHRSQRGVTLIEALIALVVMAIGMLGIVGVQTTLRANSDTAKQRSEAIRMAQQKVEEFRGFAQLAASASASPYFGYGDFANGTDTMTGNNADYTRVWQVWGLDASMKGKTLKVSVGWADRAATTVAGAAVINQTVTLTTVVAGIAPELSATLAVPGEGDTRRRPVGRNRGIPITAKDLGDGTSGLMPPGSSGVAWVFNNTTGLIRLCTTTAATTSDLDSTVSPNITCSTDYAILVAGYIDYSLGGSGPSYAAPSSSNFDALTGSLASEALSLQVSVHQTRPTSMAADRTCFTGIFDGVSLAYYCAPRVPSSAGSSPPWSGYIQFDYPTSSPRVETDSGDDHDDRRKVCRFRHDPTYVNQLEPLLNQNFVMIRSGDGRGNSFSCPTSPTTYFHNPPST